MSKNFNSNYVWFVGIMFKFWIYVYVFSYIFSNVFSVWQVGFKSKHSEKVTTFPNSLNIPTKSKQNTLLLKWELCKRNVLLDIGNVLLFVWITGIQNILIYHNSRTSACLWKFSHTTYVISLANIKMWKPKIVYTQFLMQWHSNIEDFYQFINLFNCFYASDRPSECGFAAQCISSALWVYTCVCLLPTKGAVDCTNPR